MERDPGIAVKGRKHLHQPVQREPAEVRVANAREVRRRETGQRAGLAGGQAAVIQHRDDARREDRLGLLQVDVGVAELAKHIASGLDQLEMAPAHDIISLLSCVSRSPTVDALASLSCSIQPCRIAFGT